MDATARSDGGIQNGNLRQIHFAISDKYILKFYTNILLGNSFSRRGSSRRCNCKIGWLDLEWQ